MDIIKFLIKLNTDFSESNLFVFDTYKTTGIHISQLSTKDQINCISFIFQNLFSENNNFTFYLFILQSYFYNLKQIDSYNTNTISKILLSSLTTTINNEINILNLLETFYPVDFSVLLKDSKITILTHYIYKIFYQDNINDTYKKHISMIIMYILKKGNYYNSKDPINVYRHYLYYLSKEYPEINSIINFKEVMIEEHHVLNIIKIIKYSNKNDNVLENINKYCDSNNLDLEKILNSTNKSNRHLLTFCKNYETFETLYKSNLIHNTDLYNDQSLIFVEGVNILKPMYSIILFKLKEYNDKVKFMTNYLGVIEIDYDNELQDIHNDCIKQVIKTNFNVLYDTLLPYIF